MVGRKINIRLGSAKTFANRVRDPKSLENTAYVLAPPTLFCESEE